MDYPTQDELKPLSKKQQVMYHIAMSMDEGIDYEWLMALTGLYKQYLYDILEKLEANGYIRKLNRDDEIPARAPKAIRDYLQDGRRVLIFPTKKGMKYINYILKREGLNHLIIEKYFLLSTA